MKKRIRLTERDLTNIVKKVLREQDKYDDFQDFEDFPNSKIDIRYGGKTCIIENASQEQVDKFLRQVSIKYQRKVEFLIIQNCERAYFESIDLCDFEKLQFVNLRGTENDFEENYCSEDFEQMDEGLYFHKK